MKAEPTRGKRILGGVYGDGEAESPERRREGSRGVRLTETDSRVAVMLHMVGLLRIEYKLSQSVSQAQSASRMLQPEKYLVHTNTPQRYIKGTCRQAEFNPPDNCGLWPIREAQSLAAPNWPRQLCLPCLRLGAKRWDGRTDRGGGRCFAELPDDVDNDDDDQPAQGASRIRNPFIPSPTTPSSRHHYRLRSTVLRPSKLYSIQSSIDRLTAPLPSIILHAKRLRCQSSSKAMVSITANKQASHPLQPIEPSSHHTPTNFLPTIVFPIFHQFVIQSILPADSLITIARAS